jgi:hypothetical protein
MTRRRVDALTKERMWGGLSGGLGGGGFSGGGFSGGGGLGGGGAGAAFGGNVSSAGFGPSRAVTFGQRSYGGGGGGGGGYRDLDAVAREVEEQTSEEVRQLGRLAELKAMHREGTVRRLATEAATAALVRLWRTSVEGVPLGRHQLKRAAVSNHMCSVREVRAVTTCAKLPYTKGAGYNDTCPISLCDFEEEEVVVRLPGGHLIASEAYDDLLRAARNERRIALDPFTRRAYAYYGCTYYGCTYYGCTYSTRREIPPSSTPEEMRHFCSAPLQAPLTMALPTTALLTSTLLAMAILTMALLTTSASPRANPFPSPDSDPDPNPNPDPNRYRPSGSSVSSRVYLAPPSATPR